MSNIYTPVNINKAKISKCDICDKYITEKEAQEKEFHYSKTKRGSEVFIHLTCWKNCMSRKVVQV